MDDAAPSNPLEAAIAEAKAGRLPIAAMLRALADAELLMPSGAPVAADGAGLRPLLFDRNRVPMVACYTAIERVRDVDRLAVWLWQAPARTCLPLVPPDHGLVLNPGQPIGFEIDPAGLRRVLDEFV
ncbi:SseB family protein [Sphingomonas lenta]|uniref:SseB family protein n=1 Tax=Sphingomonas lenta TaxID=1141887 RepID=UPI001595F8BB|nr:SseB family protein [Sphingomonas lenta]